MTRLRPPRTADLRRLHFRHVLRRRLAAGRVAAGDVVVLARLLAHLAAGLRLLELPAALAPLAIRLGCLRVLVELHVCDVGSLEVAADMGADWARLEQRLAGLEADGHVH